MPLIQQATTIAAQDWITVHEAAQMTNQSLRAWQLKAQKLFHQNKAMRGAPPGGRGRPCWYVARTADPALSKCPDATTRAERLKTSLLEDHSSTSVDRAYRRFYWVQQWRAECARPRNRGETERTIAAAVARRAKQVEGDEFKISARSLSMWWSRMREVDKDGKVKGVAGLVDKYRRADVAARSSEAVEYFYSLFHTRSQHTIVTCHEATVLKSVEESWSWPASYRATVKWLHENDDLASTCLMRDGPSVYSKRFMEHIERDHDSIPPAHTYVLDHTQCDFWISHRHKNIRPWLTTIMDLRSRKLVGWHVGATPNQDGILSAMRMAFRDHAIPQRVHVDRGKDFTSQLLTGCTKTQQRKLRSKYGPNWREQAQHSIEVQFGGILGELGITIIMAIPYAPQSKAVMERWYRRFQDQFSRTMPTFCGNNPKSRPEALEVLIDDAHQYPIERTRELIAEYMELYNGSYHGGIAATPDKVWSTADTLRRASDRELLSLMHTRGVYKVGKNGVRVSIRSHSVTYGRSSAKLLRLKGRPVIITVDPSRCEHAYAFTLQKPRRFIARLDANDRLPSDCTIAELSDAIHAVEKRRKVMRKARSEMPNRMRNANAEVRAMRARQLDEVRQRATGTDHAQPNVQIVHSGFEPSSIDVQPVIEDTVSTAISPDDLEDLL